MSTIGIGQKVVKNINSPVQRGGRLSDTHGCKPSEVCPIVCVVILYQFEIISLAYVSCISSSCISAP